MSNHAAKAWLGTFATSSFILICHTATGILTARLLLPEGRGALAAILVWPQLVANIGLMNLNTAITRRASQPDASVQQVAATGLYLSVALAAITMAMSILLLPILLGEARSQWLEITRSYLLAFLPLHFSGTILIAVRHAQQKFTQFNILRSLQAAVYLLGLIILWLSQGVTVEAVLWFNWLGTAVVAVVQWVEGRSLLLTRPSWREAVALMVMASRFKVASLAATVAHECDRLVIVTVLDTATIGLYAVAVTAATSGLGVLTSSFQSVLLPKVARQTEAADQRQLLGRGLRYAMVLSVGMGSGLILALPVLMPLLFGAEFIPAIVPAMVLVVAHLPKVMRHIIVNSLYGLDQPRPITLSSMVASVCFATLLLGQGAMGQAPTLLSILVALALSNVVELGYLLHHLYGSVGLTVQDWWGLTPSTISQVLGLMQTVLFQRWRRSC
jgi:O-antigen/teichoic acid export membrane protein